MMTLGDVEYNDLSNDVVNDKKNILGLGLQKGKSG